jgi:Cd(II)/Pb(II)-responsive transcriptional regulator
MKIGELAKAARCTPETVRFYEKEGLITGAQRSEANYRRYTNEHVERLRFIRNCRALDITHEEIRSLLGLIDHPANRCESIDALLSEHIGHVDARLAELQQLRSQLVDLRKQCTGERSVEACGIVQGLAAMETVSSHAKRTHVG